MRNVKVSKRLFFILNFSVRIKMEPGLFTMDNSNASYVASNLPTSSLNENPCQTPAYLTFARSIREFIFIYSCFKLMLLISFNPFQFILITCSLLLLILQVPLLNQNLDFWNRLMTRVLLHHY